MMWVHEPIPATSKVEKVGEREGREPLSLSQLTGGGRRTQKRQQGKRCMPLSGYNDEYKIIFSGLKDWPVPVFLLCSSKLAMKKRG